MPRILHIADTHLGYQAYPRVTPDGFNQREIDFQEAFRRAVDSAIHDPPDVFLHAGDLFDHPRPTNRAIAFALQQVRRLSQAEIPTILVSGNHDAPRMRETGSIFRIFEGLSHVTAVYKGVRETVNVGDMTIHAVPQAITQEAFQAQLRACHPDGPGRHVLVVHGTVLGVEGLFTSEFNEYQIPLGDLRADFDYIALGHFHNHKRVASNAYYAGSPEYCSFSEAGQAKGWLRVEIGESPPVIRLEASQARPMVDLGELRTEGWTAEDVQGALRMRLEQAPPGAILRATVRGVDRGVARTIDWEALRGLRRDAIHLELRVEAEADAHALDGESTLGSLSQEFEAFLGRYPLQNVARESVREEALRYLAAEGAPTRAA